MSYGTGRSTGAVRVILAALLGAAFLVASAMPAAAHTALEASSPKAGSRIGAAPSQILMDFTTPIFTTGFRVAVHGPDGLQYQAGPAQVAGSRLAQGLKPLGPAGKYVVEFRVVASDGHPLTSKMDFTLTKPGPAAGGSKVLTSPDQVFAVPASTSSNNAPPWGGWVGGVATLILASGALLFGRRVTRDLD